MFCRPGCQFWLAPTRSFRTLNRPPEVPSARPTEYLPKSLHSSETSKKQHPNLQLHTIVLKPESRSMVLNRFKFGMLSYCA